MASFQCPAEWDQWVRRLATGLHGRNSWRLAPIITGMLFARGRRTVTTWLRAVGIGADYADYYYFLESVGRNAKSIAAQLLAILVQRLPLPDRVLLVIDDSPTKRLEIRHPSFRPARSDKWVFGLVGAVSSLLRFLSALSSSYAVRWISKNFNRRGRRGRRERREEEWRRGG